MTTYRAALTEAMTELAQLPSSVFLGQAIAYKGTGMTPSFAAVPRDKLIEMPVAEDLQLGVATGLAIQGYLPISVYPRINFLLLAMSQLVLHLDALPIYGNGYRPRVIIRTAVASHLPLDPGIQHLGDYTQVFRQMLRATEVIALTDAADILPAYRRATTVPYSTILVEYARLYEE